MKFLFAFGMFLFGAMSCTHTYAQAFDSFIFFNDDYKKLQTRAKNAQKPYFIYFYANWSMPAKEMNEKTFKNGALVRYATDNYLGISLDAESKITDGEQLAKLYKVLYYPAVVFFTPEGKETDRVYGFVPAKKLLAKMQSNVHKTGQGKTPDFSYKLIQKQDNKGDLLSVSVRTQRYNGYGLQVGVFEDYKNVFAKVRELQEKHHYRNVMVYVKEIPGKKDHFKVILGPLFTKAHAKNTQKLMAKKLKTKTLIVELDDLDY